MAKRRASAQNPHLPSTHNFSFGRLLGTGVASEAWRSSPEFFFYFFIPVTRYRRSTRDIGLEHLITADSHQPSLVRGMSKPSRRALFSFVILFQIGSG